MKKEICHANTAKRVSVGLKTQGQLEEAVSEHQNALHVFPHDEEAYFRMGKAYSALAFKTESPEYLNQAVKCFLRAIEFAHDFEDAKDELKKLLEAEKDFEKIHTPE